MSFSTVEYFIFIFAGVLIYYIIPKKIQWVWLLILSYIYYLTFSIKGIFCMFLATGAIYVGAIMIEKIQDASEVWLADNKESLDRTAKKQYKAKISRKKRSVMVLVLIVIFGMLAVIKYTDFAIGNINLVFHALGKQDIPLMNIAFPVGISFFTFQASTYIIDVYQGKYKAERNPFKIALFVSFFPQILQGPIGRYNRLGDQLYKGYSFDLTRIQFGLQRIFWGLFKKIVLADRSSVFVYQIFDNYENYGGFYYIMAVLMYSIQLYMDFSGGIDIVIGTAEMFGIKMDENFRQPYFSKSIGEFWRRWHITLGTWMKDYIFYPMSLSKKMNKFGKWGKKHLGNTVGKVLPICFANLVIFFLVGVWHGASWKYIMYGMYNGVIIAFSNLMEPVYKKTLNALHINASSKAWKLWQIIRTFILVNIGWYFDMGLNLRAALCMIRWSIQGVQLKQLYDGTMFTMGLELRDFIILIVGCIVVFIVSVLKEKGVNVRESLASKPLPVRWAVYYAFAVAILIFGYVGASQGFLYANF